MNWLSLIQFFLALSPEVLALIATIAKAVDAAPPEHKDAIQTAVSAVVSKNVAAPGA